MATLYIHVGLHKTGSTAIQSTLFRLPPRRRPHLVSVGRSPNIARALNEGFVRHRGAVDDGLRERVRRNMADILAKCAGRDAVVSSEAFEVLRPDDLAEFMSLVRHDAVRMIAYVREPYSLISSVTQQRIRGTTGAAHLRPIVVDYRFALEKFERYGLSMVRYDRATLRHGCVVRDFMSRIGHPVGPRLVVSANESLSRTAVALLFMRNRWREANGLPPDSCVPIMHLLPTIEGPKFRLHPALIETFLENRRTNVQWAVDRFGPGWVVPTEPRPDDVRSEDDLLVLPPSGHDWLAAHDGDYRRTDDPLAIGAAMDRLNARTAAARSRRAPQPEAPAPADAEGHAPSPG